jgi:hypothetical protein
VQKVLPSLVVFTDIETPLMCSAMGQAALISGSFLRTISGNAGGPSDDTHVVGCTTALGFFQA